MTYNIHLLGLSEVKHICYNGKQHTLTQRVVIVDGARLCVECNRVGVVVVTTTLICYYRTLLLVAMVRGAVVMSIACVNMVKGGMHIGLMVTALASKGNDIACHQYRNV